MTQYPDAVALTRKLLSFDTINPPGAEEACAAYVGTLLEAAGFRVDYAAFAPTRTSLVARIGRLLGDSKAIGRCHPHTWSKDGTAEITVDLSQDDSVNVGAAPRSRRALAMSAPGRSRQPVAAARRRASQGP